MKKNETLFPGGIAIELLSTLEDFGIVEIIKVINEIYTGGEIPEDIIKNHHHNIA